MFFQNLFDQEFQGYLVLGDRQASATFKVPANKNLQTQQVAWNSGPYNFGANTLLKINYCWDRDFKNWSSFEVLADATSGNNTARQVADKLNSDSTFASLFTANVSLVNGEEHVSIKVSSSVRQNIKFYFNNDGAEIVLGFNKKAGVAEIPSYFERHTISNRFNYTDSNGCLIKLDPLDAVDSNIITEAGFTIPAKEDYELLQGRSGLFMFQKLTVDGSDRITQVIEYSAGSKPGDFARKINYLYSGSNTNPSQVTETPYVLTSGDLVTP